MSPLLRLPQHSRHSGSCQNRPHDVWLSLPRTRMGMDLDTALAWLAQHVNLERDPAPPAASRRLDRVRRLVELMGDPQAAYPVIHLTGTNGKGSTARMVTSLLVEAGLTVGTYTSPHLERINERIARNNEPIADDDLAVLLEDLERIEPAVGVTNSYFELLTAGALKWFAD